MKLGAFSISLAVEDIAASKAFYEQLGFEQFHGEESQNWVMLKNGETVIGLFQDMFPANVITFNPGWNQKAETLDSFDDVRAIQASLKDTGINLDREADIRETGPAHIALTDPDGNSILIDQHV
ncbi:VOC family protein [Pontixanthobacter sp. CEM42]|uniref:VOC family protein n=1 Tax=Pontixanthobacter sp. CEM42 TaxID=2792077 RepID=UPI001ADF8105|nr:VOC family protein [Pontixanthobacter sp. CEM42]